MTEESPSGKRPVVKILLIIGGVLGVIGAGVAGVLLVQNVAGKMQAVTTTVQMHNVESAIQTYQLTHRALPPTAPIDAWGNPIVYTVAADGKSYTLVSLGADGAPGAPGGEGEDADIER